MSLYVYSTLSCDVTYQNHVSGANDMPVVVAEVRVMGGAGVANDRLITPQGVATSITEQDAEALRNNPVFRLHEENGFVRIEAKKIDIEKVVADMTARDESAPLISEDLPPDMQPNASATEDAPAATTRAKKR